MTSKISLNVFAQRRAEIVEIARAAESAGVLDLGIADTPLITRDLYLSCSACLHETSKLRLHTAVTNPVTRHPSVTAGSLLTLCEQAPGRVAFGIATGDSALWGVGLKPAKITEMSEYIVAVRALLRGEEASWRGTTFRGHWPDFDPALAPPIYVAVSGPRVLKASAQVADGLIIAEMGYAPEDIARVHDLIDQACAEVDRDPQELDIWWLADLRFAEDTEAALAQSIGSATQWLIMGSTRGKGIPEGFVPKLRELHADTHSLGAYVDQSRGAMLAERAKKLGIYDWLVRRGARLHGRPEDIAKRMDELTQHGVMNWHLWPEGESSIVECIEGVGKLIEARSE